jgi:hypothetical protein
MGGSLQDGFGQQLADFGKNMLQKSIGVIANRAGPMLTSTISGLFKDATAAVAANPEGNFDQILASMASGLKARVASLPVVGDIAIGIINLINAAADQVDRDTAAMLQRQETRNADAMRRVQEKEAGARAAFDASEAAKNPQQRLQESIRRINQEKQAAIAAFQERTAKELEANKMQGDAENKGMISQEAQQRAIDERDRALKAEVAHQEELAQQRIATARETAAREQAAIDADIAAKRQAAIEKAQQETERAAEQARRIAEKAMEDEQRMREKAAQEQERQAKEEAEMLEKLAKEAADAKIEQIERVADERDEAIQAEIEALREGDPQAAENRELQAAASNVMGSIDTALGSFKFAQADADTEIRDAMIRQAETDARIEELQIEQKNIALETKRSIDEIKMKLKEVMS